MKTFSNIILLLSGCFLMMKGNAQAPFVKIFGDTAFDESAAFITRLNSGNLLLLGSSHNDSIGGQVIAMVKLDADGNQLWEKHFGTGGDDIPGSVFYDDSTQTFIVAGGTVAQNNQDGLLLEVDTTGTVLWQKTFGDTSRNEFLKSAARTAGNQLMVAGLAGDTAGGGSNVLLMKTDSAGNLLWQKEFGQGANAYSQAIRPTTDGHFLIAADKQKPDNNYAIYAFKADTSGNIIWEKEISTPYNTGAQNILLTKDGNYLILGESSTATSPDFDIFLAKLNPAGSILWEKYIPDTEKSEAGFSALENDKGQLLIAAYGFNEKNNKKEAMFLVTDSTGNPLYKSYHSGTGIAIGYSICASTNGGHYLAGETVDNGSKQFLLVLDTTSTFQLPTGLESETASAPNTLSVYPNPSAGQSVMLSKPLENFQVRLFSIDGKLMRQQQMKAKSQTIQFAPPLKKGTYIIQIQTKEKSFYQKLIFN